MFKEITILLLAIAIFWVLAATHRMRSKSYDITPDDEQIRGDDLEAFVDSLRELTLPQLEQKVEKLKRRMKIISTGFVSMNRIQQQRVIEAVREIKEKISIIKEVIDNRYLSQQSLSKLGSFDDAIKTILSEYTEKKIN